MIMGSSNTNKRLKKNLRLLKLQQSNVFVINIPLKFVDKTFGQLFDFLIMDHKMIALGLYRGEKIKFNTKPYVYIRPPPEVKILAKDKVYVLSEKQPKGCKLS